MSSARILTVYFALVVASVPATGAGSGCDHVLVRADTMRAVIETIDGYDTSATTNQSRFVADFLFALAATPSLRDVRSFQIQPDRFLDAWLAATSRPRAEAPISMSKVLEFGQRFTVDTEPDVRYGQPADRRARRALSVRVSWAPGPDVPSHYRYHDSMAEPEVRVRHSRVITYLLLDFGDWIAYEHMTGIAGRPTTGALGAVFNLLGTARIQSTRLAVADDDTQVIRTRARKLFEFTTLATVMPDGHARRGVPDDRDDLQRLARRLDARLDVEPASTPPRACSVGD